MIVFVNGKLLNTLPASGSGANDIVCFADFSAKSVLLAQHHIHVPDRTQSMSTFFESYSGFDHMSLSIPDMNNSIALPQKIEIYFSPDRLLLFHEDSNAVNRLIETIENDWDPSEKLEKVLHQFFSLLMDGDSACLANFEAEIADIEDSIAINSPTDYSAVIGLLRKRLLKLKRYYETLVVLLEDLQENQNGLLSEQMIRLLHFQTNKADRLYHSVLNLRDYVTQVREAYQAQLDIQQNQTMKLFTVITAIFLPLSLIAGWYGMNISMPEYSFAYSYPIVIGVSVLLVIGLIVYFKRHKWF